MSSGMSKEELLDQKIAQIKKKNEEILRRRQVIEEDKKFAEQQNAMVKLRPSTDDWPRERTPALRPSQREKQIDDPEQLMSEPVNQNKGRGLPPSRGRGEAAGKGPAPPPDPVSFLADPERDYSMDKESQSFTRGAGRSFRDFKRDGPRRGRGFRGRGSYGHQRPSSNSDDAWREERYRIDEARINRQKSADGKWRREWDSEKINLESTDDSVSQSSTTPSGVSGRLDQWKQQPRNYESEDSHESPNFRGRSFRGGGPSRGGRGRGNYKVYLEHSPPSPNAKVNISKYSPSSPPMPSKENYRLPVEHHSLSSTPNTNLVSSSDYQRIVTNVGDSFKVIVPNVSSVTENLSLANESRKHNSRKSKFHRQHPSSERGYRQRLSQSQSSYSEDELQKNSDQEKFSDRKSHKPHNDSQSKRNSCSNTENVVNEGDKTLDVPKSQKPPLPPFRTSLPKSTISVTSKELEEGEGSWEDVTTSGNESIGDDYSSLNPSQKKYESFTSESDCNISNDSNLKDPTDIYTPEDFIQLVPANNDTKNATNFTDFPVSSVSIGGETFSNETVENVGKFGETDPVNILTPDDFIKFVQPESKSAENATAVSCLSQTSPTKNENLTEEFSDTPEGSFEKSNEFNHSEKVLEKPMAEPHLKTNESILIEKLEDLAVTTESSGNVQENLTENEKASS